MGESQSCSWGSPIVLRELGLESDRVSCRVFGQKRQFCAATGGGNWGKMTIWAKTADKVEWDQADAAPYLDEMLNALDRSLDEAAQCYLRWMWTQQRSLRVIHPWLKGAYEDLSGAPW